MEFSQILLAFLALVFVLGLMFITLWLIKFCQQKGINYRINYCLKKGKRIKIIENQRLDIKNSVILLECDNQEFLILLGSNSNTILNQTPKKVK